MKLREKKTLLLLFVICLSVTVVAQGVKDFENNLYDTITIGTQTWMKSNLKATKFNDGTAISMVKENGDWALLSGPAFCWYNNDEALYRNTYGALYNWWVTDTKTNGGKNVCPAGWHVATNGDWTTLINFLGGEAYAGGKLKDSLLWKTPNKEATNESGFSALPLGGRDNYGKFSSIREYGWWWTSTESDASAAFLIGLGFDYSDAGRGADSKKLGNAVRCIRD